MVTSLVEQTELLDSNTCVTKSSQLVVTSLVQPPLLPYVPPLFTIVNQKVTWNMGNKGVIGLSKYYFFAK